MVSNMRSRKSGRRRSGVRASWMLFGWLLVLAALCRPALGAGQVREVLPAGLDAAIGRGLTFLQKQQKRDGSFDAVGPANAVSGLAILAFLSAGHTPDVGKYGLTVRSAVDYLVRQQPEDGYYGKDGGRMYSHAIVTVALAEVYGTETELRQREQVRAALEKALKVICAAQDVKKEADAAGGWRYEPSSADSDLSVSGWCMLALRACQNAGLIVPKQRVDRSAGYTLRCFRPEQEGFAYMVGGEATASMTGVAVLNLYLLDALDREEVAAGVKFLSRRPIAADAPYYSYSVYYATQAAFQAGGSAWPIVWKRTCDQLLPAQRQDDGSWKATRDEPGADSKAGRFYSTAMACLTLSAPLRVLPVYQR